MFSFKVTIYGPFSPENYAERDLNFKIICKTMANDQLFLSVPARSSKLQ